MTGQTIETLQGNGCRMAWRRRAGAARALTEEHAQSLPVARGEAEPRRFGGLLTDIGQTTAPVRALLLDVAERGGGQHVGKGPTGRRDRMAVIAAFVDHQPLAQVEPPGISIQPL